MNCNDRPRAIEIRANRLNVETFGVAETLGFELRLDVEDAANTPNAGNLLDCLAQYFMSSPVRLMSGQTLNWGSSLLVARQVSSKCIAFDETDLDGQTIIPTVDRAIVIWDEQSKTCVEHNVNICPARFGDMIAVSPHVFEGVQHVEGIRYDPTPVMSGWWLFTEDYDGTEDGFASMKSAHVFEVLRHRIDVAKFLALPKGYAFRAYAPEAVWFESPDVS